MRSMSPTKVARTIELWHDGWSHNRIAVELKFRKSTVYGDFLWSRYRDLAETPGRLDNYDHLTPAQGMEIRW